MKELLTLLARNGLKIPKYVREAEELSPFAIVTRYPGRVGPVLAVLFVSYGCCDQPLVPFALRRIAVKDWGGRFGRP